MRINLGSASHDLRLKSAGAGAASRRRILEKINRSQKLNSASRLRPWNNGFARKGLPGRSAEGADCHLAAVGAALVDFTRGKSCAVGIRFVSLACASAISSAVAGIGQTMSRPLPKE